MLTDEQCKLLTEKLLGECWHMPNSSYAEPWVGGKGIYCYPCKICGRNYSIDWKPRTFTTPDDFFALWSAMRKRPDWKEFEMKKCRYKLPWHSWVTDIDLGIIDCEIFPRLCAKWLEEKGE